MKNKKKNKKKYGRPQKPQFNFPFELPDNCTIRDGKLIIPDWDMEIDCDESVKDLQGEIVKIVLHDFYEIEVFTEVETEENN